MNEPTMTLAFGYWLTRPAVEKSLASTLRACLPGETPWDVSAIARHVVTLVNEEIEDLDLLWRPDEGEVWAPAAMIGLPVGEIWEEAWEVVVDTLLDAISEALAAGPWSPLLAPFVHPTLT